MSASMKDFYAVLGVSWTATQGEITKRYRELVKENHPDKYTRLKSEYKEKGDPDLIRMIDEKIRETEEFMKEINEAYETLSDPDKRAEYDKAFSTASSAGPDVRKPEIVVDCGAGLDFGTLHEGDVKIGSFVIDNKGGPVADINIDWETLPFWAEMQVLPEPRSVFPITVKIVVKATKVAEGFQKAKILITADDGQAKSVTVIFACVVLPATAGVTAATGGASATPTPPFDIRNLVMVSALASIALCILISIVGIMSLKNAMSTAEATQQTKVQAAGGEYARLGREIAGVRVSDVIYKKCSDGLASPMCPGQASSYRDEGWVENTFAGFSVWNESQTPALIYISGYSYSPGYSQSFDMLWCNIANWNRLVAGGRIEVWCHDRSFVFGQKGNRPSPPRDICVDIKLELDGGSYQKLSGENPPTGQICRGVSFR